jgi:hypothetical protein
MGFEALPAEYEEFFKSGGELPASLRPAPEAPAPQAAPVAPVQPVAETPVAQPTTIAEPPPAPTANPYLERLLAEREAQITSITKQMEALQTRLDKAVEIPAPDPQTDPLGHMTHTLSKLQAQLDAMQNSQKETHEQTQQQTQQQQFAQLVNNQVQTFKAANPDYEDAYQHLIKTRTQDFRDLGMTEQQIRTAIGQEEMTITQNAFAQGKNPAEIVYNFAKRYGYQPKVAAKPENKLETIQKGMEASQSLQRGTPPEAGEITTDNIMEASEATFNRMVADKWEEIFGLRKGVL